MNQPRRSSLPVFLLLAAFTALAAGYAAARWLRPHRAQPEPWTMQGEWIAAPAGGEYVGYFRQTVWLDAEVAHAWLALAARDVFELSVNGKILGSDSLWKPNRAYQFANTERGQRLADTRGVPSAPYAREYQWEGFAHWRFPTFFDLRSTLRPGRNVICVKIDARAAPASFCADGSIVLGSGATVPLATGPAWKSAANVAREVSAEWIDADYSDLEWAAARTVAAPGQTWRIFDPAIFARVFAGEWLRAGAGDDGGGLWFETTWDLDRAPHDAWLRLMANRPYDLYLNGAKVDAPASGAQDLALGKWVVNAQRVQRVNTPVDALDPDDAGELFGSDHAQPETVTPTSLGRDLRVSTFDAVSVGAMLRAGPNRVTVRLDTRDAALKWSPQLALDGGARWAGGGANLRSDAGWSVRFESGAPQPAMVAGTPARSRAELARLRYLGHCHSIFAKLREWALLGGGTALLILAGGALLARRPERRPATCTAFAFGATVLGAALALDASFAVRDEIVWMQQSTTWLAVLLAALAAGGAGWWLGSRGEPTRPGTWPPGFVSHAAFLLGVAVVLAVCAVTRVYRLDFQPTDADEWASLQTILAVAETGTPRLIEGVYYTRSPLYHYFVGAVVAVFGANEWTLRVPSAVFALATCALLVRCGSRLLGSRWVGLGAAALFAVHPLMINIGHQVRFYQQQQFFALLTVYAFCRGFAVEQSLRQRYLALAAFFGAVFSQEISVMLGAALLPAWFLFAERKSWREEAGWLLAAGCGLVFVALDFVIFQTVCLTKVEGVSPRIEPALKLNLMFPGQLTWIFGLFARLHLALSAVFFLGLPFALWRGGRSVFVLALTFFSGLVLSTVLISGPGLRFQYWLVPLFLLLAVDGAREFAAWLHARSGSRSAWASPLLATAAVLVVALSWSPWKIPGSYATKLMPDVDGAVAFLRENAAPTDAIAVTAPHTAATLVKVGRVDYDIEIPLMNDFVYRRNGRLIDRNGGAEVMGRLDDLQEACARHERLWVMLNRDIRFRAPGQRIAWLDPGGRFDLFVRTNFELRHQGYLTDLYLWDTARGRLQGLRRRP